MFTAQLGGVVASPLSEPVGQLALAAALGLFLGLEREWADKAAGIRTFSLVGLLGASLALVAVETDLGGLLLGIGAVLVVTQGVLLAVKSLSTEGETSLRLTTAVSMLVTYAVGVLVVVGFALEGVVVAVLSSSLLVLRRELHSIAGGLSRRELRSATEFAVLAFVIYPLLPPDDVSLFGIGFPPRVAWLMVVTVAGIGIANYALVRTYGGRGIAVTGFFGGLASSTAVVGTMLDHVSQRPAAASYAVAAVLLADAAMALRNLVIVLAFTIPSGGAALFDVLVPLGVIVAGSFAVAAVTADWGESVEIDLESPFSLRNALAFGGVFLLILVVTAFAQAEFGTTGLYVSALLSGLVSSAGATTSAVVLYLGGGIGSDGAVIAVLLATASSIAVKAGLAAAGPTAFSRRVAAWSLALLAAAGAATAAVAFLG